MNTRTALAALGFLTLLSSCASTTLKPSATTATLEAPLQQNSTLDMNYTLGHSHRRVLMEERDSKVVAQSFVDHVLLKTAAVNPPHFHAYFNQVADFVSKNRAVASATPSAATPPSAIPPSPTSEAECRAPYSITMQQNGQTPKTIAGCRQGDDSAFNRLVNDGEYLLFSSKK
jgi:hypothetical protein